MKKNKSYKPMLELKINRIRKGLTQADLAQKVGVSQNTISMYESGLRYPKKSTIEKLAQVLNCQIEEIE